MSVLQSPLRWAVQVVGQRSLAHDGRPFGAGDVLGVLECVGRSVEADRVRAYLTIQTQQRRLVEMPASPVLGGRWRPGNRWSSWVRPVRSVVGLRDGSLYQAIEPVWWRDRARVLERLRAAREDAGMTQAQTAMALGHGWSKQRLHQVETGRRPLRLELLILLARIYETTIDDIVGDALEEVVRG